MTTRFLTLRLVSNEIEVISIDNFNKTSFFLSQKIHAQYTFEKKSKKFFEFFWKIFF